MKSRPFDAWIVDFYYPLGNVYREVYVIIQHVNKDRLFALSLLNKHNHTLVTRWRPFTAISTQAILVTYAAELIRRRSVIIDSPMSIDHRYLSLIYQYEYIVLSNAFYPRRYKWSKELKSWCLPLSHRSISWDNPQANYQQYR